MTQNSNQTHSKDTIRQGRQDLASRLEDKQNQASVEDMAHEAMASLRENVGPYARRAEDAVRANPMALALVGAGVAWMLFGNNGDDAPNNRNTQRSRGRAHDDDESWMDTANRYRARAERAAAKYRHRASDQAEVARELAEGFAHSFQEGLEEFSDSARERIIAARGRAYSAVIVAEKQAGRAARKTGRMIEDHPLMAGALALAVGAGVAAALPNTRFEDRAFGQDRDDLLDDAKRMFKDERKRAKRMAMGVADELKSSAQDVLDLAKDAAREAPDRMKDRAEAEAKKQG
jgi:ElaB/YqjD/DUF883 family membrane-anchored ribosome-binding protein